MVETASVSGIVNMTPVQLMQKWSGLIEQFKAIGIPTWTELETLAYCAEQASHARSAVEIGTYMGASAWFMVKANPRLHLWCVDTFSVFGTKRIAEMFLDLEIRTGRVEIIVGDSAIAARMLHHMKGKLDYVWVDDGHAELDVQRDIQSFLPLVKNGGQIFGHDWDGDNDVARGVKMTLPNDQIKIVVPRVWSFQKTQ